MINTNFFFCYNIRLADYLIKNNHKFITKAYTKDQRKFYLFNTSDELNTAIQEYKKCGMS